MVKSKKLSKSKGKKEDDDTVKPKRGTTSYFFFANEHVPQLKKDKGISHKEAVSEAGAMWNTMSDAKKKKYNDLAA